MVMSIKDFQKQFTNEFNLKYRSENFAEAKKFREFISAYDKDALKEMFIENLFISSIIKADIDEWPDLDHVVFGLLSDTSYEFNKYDQFDEKYELVAMSDTANLKGFLCHDSSYISIIPKCLSEQFNASVLVPEYKKLCDNVFGGRNSRDTIRSNITIGEYTIEVSGTLEYDRDTTTVNFAFNARPCTETVADIDAATINEMDINIHLKKFLRIFTQKYFARVNATNVLNSMEEWLEKDTKKDREVYFVQDAVYALMKTNIYRMGPASLASIMLNKTSSGENAVYASDMLYEIGEGTEGMSEYRMAPIINTYNKKFVKAAKKVAAETKYATQFSEVVTIYGIEMLLTGEYTCAVRRSEYHTTEPVITYEFTVQPTDKILEAAAKSIENED